MRFYTVLFLCLCCLCLGAQKDHFNLVFSGGPSFFFNRPGRSVDHSAGLGINYIFNKKNRAIVFNPGLNQQINTYQVKIATGKTVQVSQHIFSLALDMLLRISKKNQLRCGLLLSKEYGSAIVIKEKNVHGYSYSSSSNFEQTYHPVALQAGFTLGYRIPFQLFRREQSFNIKVVHIASPLVASDYTLSKDPANEDLTVLSVKARPTMLVLTLELNLQRRIKVKEAVEE